MSHDSASLETKEKDRGRWVIKAKTRNSPQVGFEPTTTELLRNNGLKEADSRSLDQPMTEKKMGSSLFFTYTGRKGYDSKLLPGREPPGQGGGGQPSTLEIRIDQSISASCQFAK